MISKVLISKLVKKRFRYGVKDPNAVAENQSNLNNFVGKFLDTEGNVKDTKGYHKAMYAAQNIDKIVNHFLRARENRWY